MAETIIEIKNLHKYFGKNEVLKGIDLDIKKGEVVVIIGPSGSGKSTFLRSMNLLEKPTKGVISFEGVDITDKNNDIFKMREKMGMVFQQFNLFPNMTVKENITLSPIKTKGVSKADAEAKAMELLEKVGLKDKADAYPTSLSGGHVSLSHVVWLWIQTFSYLTNQHQPLTQKWLVKFLQLCRTLLNQG